MFSSVEPVYEPSCKQSSWSSSYCHISRRQYSKNVRERCSATFDLRLAIPHLVGSYFGRGIALECSSLFLVSSTSDVHWDLLTITTGVAERNCRQELNISSLELYVKEINISFFQTGSNRKSRDARKIKSRELTSIFLNHWPFHRFAYAEEKRFKVFPLQRIIYTWKNVKNNCEQ